MSEVSYLGEEGDFKQLSLVEYTSFGGSISWLEAPALSLIRCVSFGQLNLKLP